jgi:hypothetical protein
LKATVEEMSVASSSKMSRSEAAPAPSPRPTTTTPAYAVPPTVKAHPVLYRGASFPAQGPAGIAHASSFALPRHHHHPVAAAAAKHAQHFPKMEFKFYHPDEMPAKEEATGNSQASTAEATPTSNVSQNADANRLIAPALTTTPTTTATPATEATPATSSQDAEVARHAQRVHEIQAMPVQNENYGALIQELLGSQEALRFELNQLKMQVDAQATELEALRRDQYTRRSVVANGKKIEMYQLFICLLVIRSETT